MSRTMALVLLFALVGCGNGEPPKLSAPDKNARTWNLNVGRWTAADLRPRQGGN
jgi:predicted small lipoprotein YifL